jgi:quinol monooxygenase YgiN
MILVIGSFTSAAKHLDQALSLSQAHVARSRKEPGCISHDVHVDVENRYRFVFIEQWSDASSLQAHFKVPEARAFVRSIAALAAVAPSMSIFDAAPVSL